MTKNILVPLFGIDSDSLALHLAHLAAQPFGAHLDCLHVRPGSCEMATAAANMNTSGFVTQELWDALEAEDAARSNQARAAFDALRKQFDIPVCGRPSLQTRVTAAFTEVLGEWVDRIAVAARTRELVVLARGESELAPQPGQLGDVLMRCGRPVLLAPEHEQTSLAATVAIAWKDCAQSARTVLAAMPFIRKARKVVILSAVEDEGDEERVHSRDALADDLRWQGIEPETKVIDCEDRSVAPAIVEAAMQSGADLLVMGSYRHSRLEEFVLGGVTRDILERAPLPVFLSH